MSPIQCVFFLRNVIQLVRIVPDHPRASISVYICFRYMGTIEWNGFLIFDPNFFYSSRKIIKILDLGILEISVDAVHANRSICRSIIPILAQKTKKVPVGTFRYT